MFKSFVDYWVFFLVAFVVSNSVSYVNFVSSPFGSSISPEYGTSTRVSQRAGLSRPLGYHWFSSLPEFKNLYEFVTFFKDHYDKTKLSNLNEEKLDILNQLKQQLEALPFVCVPNSNTLVNDQVNLKTDSEAATQPFTCQEPHMHVKDKDSLFNDIHMNTFSFVPYVFKDVILRGQLHYNVKKMQHILKWKAWPGSLQKLLSRLIQNSVEDNTVFQKKSHGVMILAQVGTYFQVRYPSLTHYTQLQKLFKDKAKRESMLASNVVSEEKAMHVYKMLELLDQLMHNHLAGLLQLELMKYVSEEEQQQFFNRGPKEDQ